MTPLVAHAGHWLIGLGFAAGPLIVIGGVVALALLERRRGRRGEPDLPRTSRTPEARDWAARSSPRR